MLMVTWMNWTETKVAVILHAGKYLNIGCSVRFVEHIYIIEVYKIDTYNIETILKAQNPPF